MKKMLIRNLGYMLAAVLIPLIVLLVANIGGGGSQPVVVEAPWYEITDDVLTVRLPVDGEAEKWICGVSDETLLELITNETADGRYVASFRNFSGRDGKVTLTLHGLNGKDEIVRTENLTLDVGENRLTVEK